ncbi:Peptide chain release factor 1 [Planctomycetes bacterium CA13]|uniref:Peptide chain release factor 1 n=2 Tax=Novipirellula herctigrandis TaxID=2527986 RepID=A0A5C5Z386_9BACT|nr:Peptide chain release factor 1 [Planctomycetes bacterium CA13]
MPAVADRTPVNSVAGPHFALLPIDTLLSQCELRTQTRSGPGGQHRNKTSSGVFLTHRPTGIVGEATELRSQAGNRAVALERLRYRLAIEVRTVSAFDQPPERIEADAIQAGFRHRYRKHLNRMNDSNPDKPAILALLLNDLHATGGQPSLVAKQWGVSTTSVVNLVRSVPQAFATVNRFRAHHGRSTLR